MHNVKTLITSTAIALSIPVMSQTVSSYSFNRENPTVLGDFSHKLTAKKSAHGVGSKKIGEPTDSPITELPGRTPQLCLRDFVGYADFYGQLWFAKQEQMTGQYVEEEEGTVYIQNPFPGYATGTYLVGHREGDKVIAELPQLIYQMPDPNNPEIMVDYYANIMEKCETEEGVINYEAIDRESVEYTISSDGIIILDFGYDAEPDENGVYPLPDIIFGMSTAEGEWMPGAGNVYDAFYPISDKPVTPPENLQTSQWVFAASGIGKFVDVGFEGSNVYIRGIDTLDFSDKWIKGKVVDGNKIVFKSKQLYGDLMGYYFYFMTAMGTGEEDVYLVDEMVCEFDSEKGIISSDDGQIMLTNAGTERVWYTQWFQHPNFKVPAETINPVPQSPIIEGWMPYNEYYGYCAMYVNLPNVGVDNDLLDTTNMYFNVILDGEVEQFEIQVDGEKIVTGDIPYGLESSPFFSAWNTNHTIKLPFAGFDTIGVQIFNVWDGNTYESGITTLDVVSGDISTRVETVLIPNEIVAEEYYSFDGKRLSTDTKGLVIKKTIFRDGSCNSSKIIRK